MICRLPQILPEQNIILCTFYVTIFSIGLWTCMAKKALPCQNTDRTHRSKVLLSAPNPNFACNNQSSRGFGALLKGLTSVVDNSCRSRDSDPQPRVTSPTLYPLEPRLPTCRGSTCAHWHPSSWWRSRRPPSLPMPRNGTAYAFESLSRFYCVIQW